MNARHIWARPSMFAELVGELERGGAGRYARIARRLGLDRTDEQDRAARLSTGVIGDHHEVGTWWST
jgi:hypothetical protein